MGPLTRAHFNFQIIKILSLIIYMYSIRVVILIFSLFGITSCGTARGVLYGAGTVLDGIATDARTVGNWIK